MNICILLNLCIIVIYSSFIEAVQSPALPPFENLDMPSKGTPVPPCHACRSLVTSFLQALDETSRSNFAGGDADWERQKLGTYENSELRLIEMQERLCSEVVKGKDQCYNLAELYEDILEEWYFKKRHINFDLLQFLCIDHLKVCCPDNKFGPDCAPCPGGVETPCGGHGRCENGGTRQKPASCVCDAGYKGELCNDCEKGYYKELMLKFSCNICDISCKDHCRGPGPKHCEVCSSGYHFVPDIGCVRELDNDMDTENSSDGEVSIETEGEEDEFLDSRENIDSKTSQHSEF